MVKHPALALSSNIAFYIMTGRQLTSTPGWVSPRAGAQEAGEVKANRSRDRCLAARPFAMPAGLKCYSCGIDAFPPRLYGFSGHPVVIRLQVRILATSSDSASNSWSESAAVAGIFVSGCQNQCCPARAEGTATAASAPTAA
jgi:hypothetical protein